MVTPAQASANIASATRLLARQLGLYVNDGSGFNRLNLPAAQQITLTNALANYVKQHPDLFDTGAADLTNPIRSAEFASNAQVDDRGTAFGDFIDAGMAQARAINPLDSQNIGTVGKYLLAAAVVVAVAYVLANRKAGA